MAHLGIVEAQADWADAFHEIGARLPRVAIHLTMRSTTSATSVPGLATKAVPDRWRYSTGSGSSGTIAHVSKYIVVACAGLSALLTAIYKFKTEEGLFTRIRPELLEWGTLLVVIVVATVVVAMILTRVTASGIIALIFAIIAFVSLGLFWLGLPVVLAGGALAIGTRAARGDDAAQGVVGIGIGAVTIAIAIWTSFTV